MNQIVEPLSLDEEAVLEIASMGERMAPVGRWEAPTRRLAALGLLRALDEFNYVITDAGMTRMRVVSTDQDQAIADMINLTRRIGRQVHEERAKLEKPGADPD